MRKTDIVKPYFPVGKNGVLAQHHARRKPHARRTEPRDRKVPDWLAARRSADLRAEAAYLLSIWPEPVTSSRSEMTPELAEYNRRRERALIAAAEREAARR